MATTMERIGNVARGETAAGGSIVELVAGAAAVVLPILGLLGVLPISLGAIAFIAIGGGMMMQGGSLRLREGPLAAAGGSDVDRAELVGGMSAEIMGGAAVSALGILALLRIVPVTLMAVAAIVAGVALLLGAGTTSRFNSYRIGSANLDDTRRELLRESVNAAAAADVLAGLSTVVLGILVLAGVSGLATQVTLELVAALSLGAALLLNGTTVGARMAALLRH